MIKRPKRALCACACARVCMRACVCMCVCGRMRHYVSVCHVQAVGQPWKRTAKISWGDVIRQDVNM